MKITVLAENTTSCSALSAEHGLSLYIETQNHKLLFDMGQTDLFSKNAEKLGVDLKGVDIAFLSHGHYDHSGGLKRFLEINNKARIYINENAFGEHYNGTEKYIGMDKALKNEKRISFVGNELKIDGELALYSCNEKEKSVPTEPFGLNIKSGERFLPDGFLHEQYLLINENGKRVLISGCSHKGIINIENWFAPNVLVGGFHLSKLEPYTDDAVRLKSIALKLLEYDTTYYTAHCTGVEQYEYMKNIMGDRLKYISTGCVFEI